MFLDGGNKQLWNEIVVSAKKTDFKEHLSKYLQDGYAPLKISFSYTLLS